MVRKFCQGTKIMKKYYFLGHWVMLVGGFDRAWGGEDLPSPTVEVISLDPTNHPLPDCLRSRNPLNIRTGGGAGGVLFGEVPHVCGGSLNGGACLSYNRYYDTW